LSWFWAFSLSLEVVPEMDSLSLIFVPPVSTDAFV
jgi:hypothetical protein